MFTYTSILIGSPKFLSLSFFFYFQFLVGIIFIFCKLPENSCSFIISAVHQTYLYMYVCLVFSSMA